MNALIPISICAVMPVAIVLIVFLAAMNSDNKRAKIIIKAIEANNAVDADKLAESLRKPKKTAREILNDRLLRGCAFSLIGLAIIIAGVFFATGENGFRAKEFSDYLMFGGISIGIGISYLFVYFVTRKELEKRENN